MFNFKSPIPLSLYIHLPWCVRKCPYCDFNSHEAKSIPEEAYVNTLLKELDEQLPTIWGRRLVSIFFGGGTPSLFSAKAIEAILQGVHARLNFGPDIEITLEANPGTLDESRFRGFRTAGINRLSLGIQSLQDDSLKALGRIHGREAALRAIECTLDSGFERFNLDLMHGLPHQSTPAAMQDLEEALHYQPPHLSWYQLTLEPNTAFYHQPPPLPADDILWEIQEKGVATLSTAGLKQYEVSAYALPGYECIHNTHYWEFGDYLGIGAGAHSKITDFENQQIKRHWQVKHPKDYLNSDKNRTAGTQILKPHDARFEFMLNALRLNRGFSPALFTERTGLAFSEVAPLLKQGQEKGLVEMNDSFVRATMLGQRFLNELIGLFLVT